MKTVIALFSLTVVILLICLRAALRRRSHVEVLFVEPAQEEGTELERRILRDIENMDV